MLLRRKTGLPLRSFRPLCDRDVLLFAGRAAHKGRTFPSPSGNPRAPGLRVGFANGEGSFVSSSLLAYLDSIKARDPAPRSRWEILLYPGLVAVGMHRIAQVPAEIVQGRYDMICPPETAYDLAMAWPRARLTVVADAGHSALEPGVRTALVAAVERFRRRG